MVRKGDFVKRNMGIFMLMLLLMLGVSEDDLSYAIDNSSNPGFIAVVVNNELMEFKDARPAIHSGRTYIPVREVSEKLGIEVTWKEDTRKVNLSTGERSVDIYVDQNRVVLSDTEVRGIPTYIENGRTMIQLRGVYEHLGYDISYISSGPIARISDRSREDLINQDRLYDRYKEEIGNMHDAHMEKIREDEKAKLNTVYLTFDDGPNRYTPIILDLLKQYDMKGTFFVLDGNMRNFPEYTKRIIEEGHSIGLHGISHDMNRLYFTSSPYSVLREMEQQNRNLKQQFGEFTILTRVPYGTKPYMKSSQFWALRNAGYRVWDWHIDSHDYKSTPSQIYRNVISEIPKYDKPVILLHDRAQTVEALPWILNYLKDNGYRSRRLEEGMRNYNFWER